MKPKLKARNISIEYPFSIDFPIIANAESILIAPLSLTSGFFYHFDGLIDLQKTAKLIGVFLIIFRWQD